MFNTMNYLKLLGFREHTKFDINILYIAITNVDVYSLFISNIELLRIISNFTFTVFYFTRFYVMCTESYLQNIPKLVRQRPKSGLKIQTVTFSNFEQTKKFNVDDSDNDNESTNTYIPNNAFLKRAQSASDKKQRRCTSATPRLFRNATVSSTTPIAQTSFDINQNNKRADSANGMMKNNHNQTFSLPDTKSSIHSGSNSNYDGETKTIDLGDEIESEYDVKIRQLSDTNSSIYGKPSLTNTSDKLAELKSKMRPKSSTTIASTTSYESESYKKFYSVSQFNKFKNKLIDRKLYHKKCENLDHINNDWLNKPIPEDKKYIAGKYSVEMKRINYANYIRKRQIFLSESLSIKKLNVKV